MFPGIPEPPARDARWIALGPGGEVFGFCAAVMARPDAERSHGLGGPVCYLSRAGVLPDRRGLGLQRSAIRVRERWARGRGAVALVTDTNPENAHSARNLTRCGFSAWDPAWAWSGRPWRYWRRDLVSA